MHLSLRYDAVRFTIGTLTVLGIIDITDSVHVRLLRVVPYAWIMSIVIVCASIVVLYLLCWFGLYRDHKA